MAGLENPERVLKSVRIGVEVGVGLGLGVGVGGGGSSLTIKETLVGQLVATPSVTVKYKV